MVARKAKDLGSPEVIVIVIKADVSRLEDCKRFVNETIRHFGALDCLINNARIGIIGLFEDQESITNQTSVMDVNFWGSVNVTHFALPHLRKSKGRIVVIGSYGGWFNTPKVSVYNASKAAQQSFFESLRLELAPDIGITVITLGLVNTRLATNEFIYKTNLDRIPLVSVEGCANAIVNGVRRGDEHLTEPQWMHMIFLWVMFLEELMNLTCRIHAKEGKSHGTCSRQRIDIKYD
ncbi:hypothetical protein R6Q59_025000 [Mikania micrantha]